MLSMIQNWQGKIEIDGQEVDRRVISNFKPENTTLHIKLYPKQERRVNDKNNSESREVKTEEQEVRITVKLYMTKKASPEFDFMTKWNNDNPMPLRIMTGHKIRETKGMVYMELHGDMYAEQMCTCMKCGKKLTNKVSQYFGIGPECGGHNYVNPFNTEEELKQAVAEYRKKLVSTTWEGWIIKSAITLEEEV